MPPKEGAGLHLFVSRGFWFPGRTGKKHEGLLAGRLADGPNRELIRKPKVVPVVVLSMDKSLGEARNLVRRAPRFLRHGIWSPRKSSNDLQYSTVSTVQ